MTGALNAYGGWVPGLEHPAPSTIFGISGGGGSTGSGTSDPNLASPALPLNVTSYDLHDATTGAWIETLYRNPVTGVFE